VKVAVVIPALDEAGRIGETVASAIQGCDRSDASQPEIIVVDGGSTDGTRERAEAAGARVVTSTRGRARQLGVGVRASCGDVLLFLHADTRLPRGYDRAIATALRDPATVGGAFRFRFDRTTPALRLIEWGARLRVRLFQLPYGDQAVFVRRAVLEGLGGVPQVPIMEDLDLVKAMKTRGRLARVPLDAVTSARRYEARGPLRTMLRHWLAAGAWALGIERERIAAWYAR
jgi:rSAM/selenodomain-associated transferase 2